VTPPDTVVDLLRQDLAQLDEAELDHQKKTNWGELWPAWRPARAAWVQSSAPEAYAEEAKPGECWNGSWNKPAETRKRDTA